MAGLLMFASCKIHKKMVATPPPPPGAIVSAGQTDKVPMVYGILTLHPDSLSYKGKDGNSWSIFGDPGNSCIVVTQNPNLYPLFADKLPVALSKNVPAVVYSGTKIAPLTIFTEEQVADISRRVLLGLNKFDVVKIMAYGTVNNLAEARAALTVIMSAGGVQSANSQPSYILRDATANPSLQLKSQPKQKSATYNPNDDL